MATFTFTVAANPTLSIDQIGSDAIKVAMSDEVIVNDEYKNNATFTITAIDGSSTLAIKDIAIDETSLTTDEILLYIETPAKGVVYEVSIDSLTRRDGIALVASGRFEGRRTKGEIVLKDIPSHWNKNPESVMRNFLTAIAIEDDRIGGSRDDRL